MKQSIKQDCLITLISLIKSYLRPVVSNEQQLRPLSNWKRKAKKDKLVTK